jgi:hypothetical protein
MTQYGTWLTYGGDARIELAVALVAAAGTVAYAGTRLRTPLRLPRPSRPTAAVLRAAWAIAIAAFLVCVSVYIAQVRHDFHGPRTVPSDPITPVTILAAGAVFLAVLIMGSGRPAPRLRNAALAAAAGAMIFELPFDLIVMARTYPAIPPDPALYRALFFVPLFLIELSTLALLATTGMVRVTRPAVFSFALMLTVFAVWALAGFGYPSAPFPIAMNVVSKLLAFVVAISLFWPQRDPAQVPSGQLERPQPAS